MTKVIAHRGSKGTHPENTLPAFREAIEAKADGIELDVHLTKDRKLVVIHDESIDRTTNGRGEVDSFTLAEIQQFDAGSWFGTEFIGTRIPSFVEVLELLKETNFQGILNIEIKTDKKPYIGIEEMVAQLMQSEQWPFAYMYSSFNLKSLEIIDPLETSISKAYIMGTSAKKIKNGKTIKYIDSIHPKIDWVIAQGSKVNDYPKHVRPWTVNEATAMQTCFRRKLAGIHTDYPREALRYRNLMEGKV